MEQDYLRRGKQYDFTVRETQIIERWTAEMLTHWKEEFSSLRYEGLDIGPVAAAKKKVAQCRADLKHILTDGLEIGTLWSEHIPVNLQYDKTHGWIFVSRADDNCGNLYLAADAIHREVERMKKNGQL